MHWQKQRGFTSEQWKRYVVRKAIGPNGATKLEKQVDSYTLAEESSRSSLLTLTRRDEHPANELHLRIKEGESSFEEVAVLRRSDNTGQSRTYAAKPAH